MLINDAYLFFFLIGVISVFQTNTFSPHNNCATEFSKIHILPQIAFKIHLAQISLNGHDSSALSSSGCTSGMHVSDSVQYGEHNDDTFCMHRTKKKQNK